jgi:hypothetical protein
MSTYLQNIDLIRQDLEGLPHLEERFRLLLDALDERYPGRIIDEAKCFIESVFRTIDINYHGEEQKDRIDRLRMPDLFTEVSQVVCLSDDETVSGQLQEMCSLHFTRVGSIRNAEGAAAHGRDGYHEPAVGLPEALYVAQSALAIGVLFFNRYQERADWRTNKRQKYEDNPEFNEWLDEQNEPIEIAGTVLTPSEALYSTDPKAYRNALIEFMSSSFEVIDTE